MSQCAMPGWSRYGPRRDRPAYVHRRLRNYLGTLGTWRPCCGPWPTRAGGRCWTRWPAGRPPPGNWPGCCRSPVSGPWGRSGRTPCTPRSPGESANKGAPDEQQWKPGPAGQPAIGRRPRRRADRGPLRHRHRRPVVGHHRSGPGGPLVRAGRGRSPSRRRGAGGGLADGAGRPRRHRRVRTKEEAEPYEEVLEATLTADGDQTVLVIEARGMPLDKVAFYGAGWQIHGEDLAAYLAGRELADFRTRFGELVTPYQELAAKLA